MIGAYVRVSSSSQNKSSQQEQIRQWLDGQGIKPDKIQWFEDEESGKSLNRPAFQQLEAEIFAGRIRTVVVWRLDRLSRSLRDGINTLAKWCDTDSYGVRVVSVTQQLDFSGATGKLVASVLLSVAELELEAIRERQAAGIASAKKRGVYKSNSRPVGSTKANPKRARVLAEKGIRPSEIAKLLAVSRATVYRYLASPPNK